MLNRSILTSAVLLLLSTRAHAQQREGSSRARLVGTVTTESGPTAEALVELLRERAVVRTERTRIDGRFGFQGVPIGEYRLRVRKLGLGVYEHPLTLPAPGDSIHVTLRGASAAFDSARRVEYGRRLTAARLRPRHWNCRVSAREVSTQAAATYEQFLGPEAKGLRESAREYRMPSARETFLRDFRGINDPRACRRLGEAIDRQYGLVSDRLRVFRVGQVYFLPDFGDQGMVVGVDGTILAIFIVPS